MTTALIVTLGGSPDPIVRSIRHHQPEWVFFLASHRSVEIAGQVCSETGLTSNSEKELAENPESLQECYAAALRCFDRAHNRGFEPEQIVVDVTGGTKAMSCALGLAATARGAAAFSYVGGERRDKGGLGVVEGPGSVLVSESPWQVFAVEERRRAAQYFNAHAYASASEALSSLLPRIRRSEQALLEPVRDVALAYSHWDRFQHKRAREMLSSATRSFEERLSALPESHEVNLRQFLAAANDSLANLNALSQVSRGFVEVLVPQMAADLIANADRRITEGKCDDAVARLYRALEMIGQAAFKQRFGIETGNVPKRLLPAAIRDEFDARYGDGSAAMKLPLFAVFRALSADGDPLGTRFIADTDLQHRLSGRNESILAHGVTPVTEAAAHALHESVVPYLPAEVGFATFAKLTL